MCFGVSVAQLAAHISNQTPESRMAPERVESNEAPLSYGQRALWFLHELAPESAAYNIAAAARIHSPIDAGKLQQALQKLVERHPALRTTFPVEAETPVQRVSVSATTSFQYEDAAHLSETALADRLRDETARPFDLTTGPLLRVSLFKRTADEHVLDIRRASHGGRFLVHGTAHQRVGYALRSARRRSPTAIPHLFRLHSRASRDALGPGRRTALELLAKTVERRANSAQSAGVAATTNCANLCWIERALPSG